MTASLRFCGVTEHPLPSRVRIGFLAFGDSKIPRGLGPGRSDAPADRGSTIAPRSVALRPRSLGQLPVFAAPLRTLRGVILYVEGLKPAAMATAKVHVTVLRVIISLPLFLAVALICASSHAINKGKIQAAEPNLQRPQGCSAERQT
jgi:hypothetical protein